MVTALAFTVYPCADVASTRAWYEEHLGLQFAGPYIEDGVEKYNEAHLGDGCFSLLWHGWLEAEAGTGNGVTFEVADIEATVASLRAAGVKTGEIETLPTCKLVAVRDREGNRVQLHQTAPSRMQNTAATLGG